MLIDLTLYILLTSQVTFLSFEGEQKVVFYIKELGPVVILPRLEGPGSVL